MTCKSLGLAVSLLFASQAFAEPLYNEFHAGASEDVVLPAFPTAKLEKEEGPLKSYRAERVPLPGMWTYFHFIDGGLDKVVMYGRGADQYLQAKEALRKRYGAPQSDTLAADSGVAVWQIGGTKIVAKLSRSYAMVVGPVIEPFTISYTNESGLEAAPF